MHDASTPPGGSSTGAAEVSAQQAAARQVVEAAYAATYLSVRRDGYAVERVRWTDGSRALIGFCRLPSVALQLAVELTSTVGEPGTRYEAVMGDTVHAALT